MKSLVSRAVAVAVSTGVAVAVPAFGLVSPAGAATRAAVSGVATTSPAALPTSNIVGTTAHFHPASLTATAIEPSGASCSATYASFEFVNKEKVSEAFVVRATGISGSLKGTLPAGDGEYICITTGYTGTAHVTLTDKRRLTVTF